MSFNSFSFRTGAKPIDCTPNINDQNWVESSILAHAFNNVHVLYELGGVYGVAHALRTRLHAGLLQDEVASNYQIRKDLYGQNIFPPPPSSTFFEHCLETLGDPMLVLLTIGGIISISINVPREGAEGAIEGCAILCAVAIVVLVSGYQNWTQDRAFTKMSKLLKSAPVTAMRNGQIVVIEQEDILVGDVISLNPGAMIPADGLLIDNTTMLVSEAALTGESDDLVKNRTAPFLSAGTQVTDGTGFFLVTAVGVNSAKGRIMASLATESEQTPLQEKLDDAAMTIGYIACVVAAATFFVSFIRLAYYIQNPPYFDENGEVLQWSNSYSQILDFLIVAVALIACGLPEGLPLALLVSLSYSLNAMKEDNNFVKVLSASETMGNVTTVVSDKTGTLTQNKMTVVSVAVGGKFFGCQPNRDEFSDEIHKLLIDGVVCNSDKRVSAEEMNWDIPVEDWKWDGDGGATETALLSWLARYHKNDGMSIMDLRSKERMRTLHLFPFSSAKKYSSVVMSYEGETTSGSEMQSIESPKDLPLVIPSINTARQYYKGAADRIIQSCDKMVSANGQVVSFNQSFSLPMCIEPHCVNYAMCGESSQTLMFCHVHAPPTVAFSSVCRHTKNGHACDKFAVMGQKSDSYPQYCTDPSHHPVDPYNQMILMDQHPLKIMTNMARSGLRCIAMSYTDNVTIQLKDGQIHLPDAETTTQTLVGFVGIKDPLRLETTSAIHTAQNAGITVIMATGDNVTTASFIAKECGIISCARHVACEGAEFRQRLDDNYAYKAQHQEHSPEFLEFAKNLRVMARCQPEDKLELVRFLKNEMGAVIGVTGDGSNDAPALKTANVGLAMYIAGTDVAKAAADILILDDNFASIIKASLWGRSVFMNIRKFIQFQLAVNVCALTLVFVTALTSGNSPLNAVQLLFINLIMDSFGALALATELPKPQLLNHKPQRPGGSLFTIFMWKNILGQAFFQLLILFLIKYYGTQWGGDQYWGIQGTSSYNEKIHQSFIYNTFVFCQVWNQINARRVVKGEFDIFGGIFDNFWFAGITALIIACQFLIIQFGETFFKTVPIQPMLWLISILLGSTQLFTGFLLRLIPSPDCEGEITVPNDTFEGAKWLDDEEYRQSLVYLYKPNAQLAKEAKKAEAQKTKGSKKEHIAFTDQEGDKDDTVQYDDSCGIVATSGVDVEVELSHLAMKSNANPRKNTKRDTLGNIYVVFSPSEPNSIHC